MQLLKACFRVWGLWWSYITLPSWNDSPCNWVSHPQRSECLSHLSVEYWLLYHEEMVSAQSTSVIIHMLKFLGVFCKRHWEPGYFFMWKKYGYMPVLGTGCISTLNVWYGKRQIFHRGKPLLENDSEAASIMKWVFHDREEWEMVLPLVFPIFSLPWPSPSDIWAVKDAWEKAGKLWVRSGSHKLCYSQCHYPEPC